MAFHTHFHPPVIPLPPPPKFSLNAAYSATQELIVKIFTDMAEEGEIEQAKLYLGFSRQLGPTSVARSISYVFKNNSTPLTALKVATIAQDCRYPVLALEHQIDRAYILTPPPICMSAKAYGCLFFKGIDGALKVAAFTAAMTPAQNSQEDSPPNIKTDMKAYSIENATREDAFQVVLQACTMRTSIKQMDENNNFVRNF